MESPTRRTLKETHQKVIKTVTLLQRQQQNSSSRSASHLTEEAGSAAPVSVMKNDIDDDASKETATTIDTPTTAPTQVSTPEPIQSEVTPQRHTHISASLEDEGVEGGYSNVKLRSISPSERSTTATTNAHVDEEDPSMNDVHHVNIDHNVSVPPPHEYGDSGERQANGDQDVVISPLSGTLRFARSPNSKNSALGPPSTDAASHPQSTQNGETKITSPRAATANTNRREVVEERGYLVDDDDDEDDMVVQDSSAAGFSSFLGSTTAKKQPSAQTSSTSSVRAAPQQLQRGGQHGTTTTTSVVPVDSVENKLPYRNNTPLRIDKDHDDDDDYYDDGLCSNADSTSEAAVAAVDPHGDVEKSDDLYEEAPSSKLFRTSSIGAASTTSSSLHPQQQQQHQQQHDSNKKDSIVPDVGPSVARRISMTSVDESQMTSMYSTITPHVPEGGGGSGVDEYGAAGGGGSSLGVLDLEALHSSESMGGAAAPPAISTVDYIGSVRSRPNTPNRLPSTRL